MTGSLKPVPNISFDVRHVPRVVAACGIGREHYSLCHTSCVLLLESMKRQPVQPSAKCNGHGEGQAPPHQQIPQGVP